MNAAAKRLSSRKEFLRGLLSGGLAAALPRAAWGAAPGLGGAGVEEVTPVEDLMREHGALDRILLVYDEALRRLSRGLELDPGAVGRAAGIVSRFIEGYHEKLEEEFLFPRLRAEGRLVGLVDILQTQHEAGRKTTAAVLAEAKKGAAAALEKPLAAFVRMYRPHAAREDTELFPTFKKIVDEKEYVELGERFEERERRLFGKEGFEGPLAQIAEIETSLGIHELGQFTPRPERP
jgi:hemerythrin-like domain-containing protein